MKKQWNDLYKKLPASRRAIIEAKVSGEIARISREPLDSNPHYATKNKELASAWREGWGDADEMLLGQHPLAGAFAWNESRKNQALAHSSYLVCHNELNTNHAIDIEVAKIARTEGWKLPDANLIEFGIKVWNRAKEKIAYMSNVHKYHRCPQCGKQYQCELGEKCPVLANSLICKDCEAKKNA